jgi:hypothetical protein
MRVHRALQVFGSWREYSSARQASAISSPAMGPMMCTPRISIAPASATIFAKPAAASIARARPLATNGNGPLVRAPAAP